MEADLAQYLTRLENGMGYEGAFAISDVSGNYYTGSRTRGPSIVRVCTTAGTTCSCKVPTTTTWTWITVSRRERPAESVSELCRIADKRMYDDKVRYYERTGATRRTS